MLKLTGHKRGLWVKYRDKSAEDHGVSKLPSQIISSEGRWAVSVELDLTLAILHVKKQTNKQLDNIKSLQKCQSLDFATKERNFVFNFQEHLQPAEYSMQKELCH